jgi:DNA-binding response OmpR family regulator
MERGIRDAISAGGPATGARIRPPDVVIQTQRDGVAIRYVPAWNRVLRVLVADDDRVTADSLAVLVRMWDHDARVAYDGAAALDMTFAYHPDVLLLDVALPEMDGFRLARVIRQQPRFNGALLIALTGCSDEAYRLLGKEAGFDHYLVKPAEPTTVEKLLRLQKARLAGSPE